MIIVETVVCTVVEWQYMRTLCYIVQALLNDWHHLNDSYSPFIQFFFASTVKSKLSEATV